MGQSYNVLNSIFYREKKRTQYFNFIGVTKMIIAIFYSLSKRKKDKEKNNILLKRYLNMSYVIYLRTFL